MIKRELREPVARFDIIRDNALDIWHKLHKNHPNPPKRMYFQSELLPIASARDRWPVDWTIVLRQAELFKVFICFSSCPWISPGIRCKSTPHTNTFVWPCGHQRRVISLILEDDLMCLRDSPLYRENPDSDFSQPSNIFNHFLFLSFFPRDSENSPDVVRYQIYSVRIPKGRVELYKKKRYFRPYHNPVTSSGYQKKLNNKVLWAMGHRTCKNNKKGRLCSRTHTAGKKAFSVQMPKMIVFLPFDLCESNFADLPGQGARPTERNWEGQNYRGLCCW